MISVTVPIFNEEDNVLPLYERLKPVLAGMERPWELIFVNDGSTDSSAARLNEIAAQDRQVRVIHFRRNFGQTAAMQAGFDVARGNVIIPIDGDLQNDPTDIPRLLTRLDEGYDVVSGWRRSRQDHALRRTLPSIVANKMISVISGVHLHDYGCTLKAYRRDVIKGVKLYGEMHRFVPIYASWMGARVAELEVTHHPRTRGKSKYGLNRIFKVMLDLAVIKFLSQYSQKPMHVFGGFGLLSFLFAFLTILWAAYLKLFDGISFIQTPLPLLSGMGMLTGIMCLLMGLLAELTMRTYHESQDKSVYSIRDMRNVDVVAPVESPRKLVG